MLFDKSFPRRRIGDWLSLVAHFASVEKTEIERAGELLDAVNQAIVASSLGANGDRPAAGSITTRDLRDKLREIRTHPM